MKSRAFKKAKDLIIKDRTDSKNFGLMYDFENSKVGVRFVQSPRKTEVHCDCMQGTSFCNNIALCYHRIKAIVEEYCEQNNLKLVKKDD